MNKIKYFLKLIAFFMLLAGTIPYDCEAQAGDKNFIDQNYIEVIGKAEMEIVPDEIYLKILLDEKDNKNKVPVQELEQLMIRKLEEVGVDMKNDLLIKDITSNFKDYILSKNKIFLSKEYQVLVHDGKTASRVFVGLEEIGISNISIEKLEHSQIVEYRKEVKINAIKAAREKASALSNAIDQEVGRAIYIQEMEDYGSYRPANMANSFTLKRSSDAGSNVEFSDVDFEKIRLEYSILCRFELK
jgi:hypothetical protein